MRQSTCEEGACCNPRRYYIHLLLVAGDSASGAISDEGEAMLAEWHQARADVHHSLAAWRTARPFLDH